MSELEHIVSKSLDAARGGYGVLSTGERLAAALVLNRADWLAEAGYTLAECIDRVGMEWMRLIPVAAKRVSAALAESEAAIERARVSADIAALKSLSTEEAGAVEFNSKLKTYGHAPGYRDVSLSFELREIHTEARLNVEIHIPKADAETIMKHIQHVNRGAWNHGEPIDKQPGEMRPSWID